MGKIEALKNFLIENGVRNPDIQGYDDVFFNNDDDEYLVYTDEEADEKVKNYIMETLWAFDTEFIINHSAIDFDVYNYDDIVKSFFEMQNKLYENANPLIYALITDMDEFIVDAIDADGRGHFISSYDGMEYEYDGFYIYRL